MITKKQVEAFGSIETPFYFYDMDLLRKTLDIYKAHGASGETAIMNALRQAREMLAGDVVGRIREGLSGLTQE